jgi:hypothetical protein
MSAAPWWRRERGGEGRGVLEVAVAWLAAVMLVLVSLVVSSKVGLSLPDRV